MEYSEQTDCTTDHHITIMSRMWCRECLCHLIVYVVTNFINNKQYSNIRLAQIATIMYIYKAIILEREDSKFLQTNNTYIFVYYLSIHSLILAYTLKP